MNTLKISHKIIIINVIKISLAIFLMVSLLPQSIQAKAPFSGTIFIDPNIISSSDPSAFEKITYRGKRNRKIFDRRINKWTDMKIYLFDVTFDDGLSTEIQVNPEFGTADNALLQAEKYSRIIGQLPAVLRTDVETVTIHKGVESFGGRNKNILIHTGQATRYEADGILEEAIMHEGAHTSLDRAHAKNSAWIAAQKADAEFISTYAKNHPKREDISESFLPYFAVTYKPHRIPTSLKNTILQTMPHRIEYFNNLQLNMHPAIKPELLPDITHEPHPSPKNIIEPDTSSQRSIIPIILIVLFILYFFFR